MTTVGTEVLDNPAWVALHGPHARFARTYGLAARYDPDVAPFHALADVADPQAWADLARLVGPGGSADVAGGPLVAFPGWTVVSTGTGVQLVGLTSRGAADPSLLRLGPADVPDMLDLIALTRPGPFRRRTVELGRYLGIRSQGTLIALAGERLHPAGWTEISAVCTHPAWRGRGLATRLVRAVAHGIRARDETPFLHAAATNTNAIRLYEHLGFSLRREVTFGHYRADQSSSSDRVAS
ncbi:GNAT family N-acetyltransferase [Symbioplanes lichenis]|uniref:GNAT family N-acetyltransferase n=1 Tax=Symbioplanes lichenis TaxID=1629072 RepID=UPI0027399714|nr:GNAT family N-acetyltransferase [Actinoplanes lichenis]